MLMEEPKFEVIAFSAEDVIVTSGGKDHPSGEQCQGEDAPMNNCGGFMV